MAQGEAKKLKEEKHNATIRDILNAASESKDIILIYTNLSQTQNFAAGTIGEIFDTEVLINHFLPNGRYDGFVVKKAADIFKVETGSKYAVKIAKLSKICKTTHDKVLRTGENGFYSLLDYANKNEKVVSVELIDSENTDAAGFVKEIQGEFCTIQMINEYGEDDGTCTFKIEDISHLSCDGDDEIILQLLHKEMGK